MTEYRKVYAYHEKNDGMYELKSYWTSSETTQFESGENLEEYRSTTENNINLKADRIEYDLDAGMLYLYSDETKIDEIPFRVSIKPKVNLGDIDDLQVTQDNSAIKLSWDDPIDIEFSGLKIVEWAGTKVIRKEGSCPDSIEDGTLVIDNKTRNAYSSTPYSDSGLVNGVEYYYRFFPYDTEGNIIGDTCGEIIRVITLVPIEIPTVTVTYTYTGDTISPTFVNYDSDKMTRSGANSAKNAGTYTVTFTPKEGYMWVDTTVEAKEVTWTINPATISVVPSQSGILTYNEQSQSPTWSNYNSDQLTISGDTNGTNAGNYTAVFTPKANYTWGDGSTSKNVIWNIGKAVISVVPSQNGIIIYNGQTQSPTWNNYNSNQLIISGDTEGIKIGDYIAYFTPTYNYIWEDGSISKSAVWSIIKNNQEYIYILGGYKNTSKMYGYNGNEWNYISDIRINNSSSGAIHIFRSPVIYDEINNIIYILDSNDSNRGYLLKYDGNFNTIGENTYNTPYKLVDTGAIYYNNEIHIFGGGAQRNGSSVTYCRSYHYKGTITNNSITWLKLNNLPKDVVSPIVLLKNNNIHMLSGTNHYEYNYTNDTWNSISTLPYGIDNGATGVVYHNEIHILGGYRGGSYDYASNHYKYNGSQWVNESTLPFPFMYGLAIVFNDEIHILSSYFSSNENGLKHYKYTNGTWVEASTLPYICYRGGITLFNA